MSVFGSWYARYYDLIYQDKDYAGESDYIDRIIETYRPGTVTMLELGSGTGRHAALFAEKGYSIHGIERSEDMLEVARSKPQNGNLRFTQDDIRTFRLERTFDTAIALFHVVNYMNSNEDLLALFRNVSRHLREDGVFLFDSWYGPAVLADQPSVRVKRWEDELSEVIRISEPVLHTNADIVDVNYQVIVHDKPTGQMRQWRETHPIRYLFTPETELLLAHAGMRLEHCEEFMSGNEPGDHTWGVLYVGRKR